MLKSIKKYFYGIYILWRPLRAWRKGLKNDAMTSFSNSFYDSEYPQTDASKKTVFNGKICIKESLEIEKTQVVCCGHPQNNYFMLNSNKISHCGRWSKFRRTIVRRFCGRILNGLRFWLNDDLTWSKYGDFPFIKRENSIMYFKWFFICACGLSSMTRISTSLVLK